MLTFHSASEKDAVGRAILKYSFLFICWITLLPTAVLFTNYRNNSFESKNLRIWWLTTVAVDEATIVHNHLIGHKDLSHSFGNIAKLSSSAFCGGSLDRFNMGPWEIRDAVVVDSGYFVNIIVVKPRNNITSSTPHHENKHNELAGIRVLCKFYDFNSKFIGAMQSQKYLGDSLIRCPIPSIVINKYKQLKNGIMMRLQINDHPAVSDYFSRRLYSNDSIFNINKNSIQNLRGKESPVLQSFLAVSDMFSVCPALAAPLASFQSDLNSQRNDNNYNISVCAAVVTVPGEVSLWVEWLEYHRMLGVQHFFIYDLSSSSTQRHSSSAPLSSPPPSLHEVLSSYILSGVVTLVPWRGTSRSRSLANSVGENSLTTELEIARLSCYFRFKDSCNWMLFLAVDQFVTLSAMQADLSNRPISSLPELVASTESSHDNLAGIRITSVAMTDCSVFQTQNDTASTAQDAQIADVDDVAAGDDDDEEEEGVGDRASYLRHFWESLKRKFASRKSKLLPDWSSSSSSSLSSSSSSSSSSEGEQQLDSHPVTNSSTEQDEDMSEYPPRVGNSAYRWAVTSQSDKKLLSRRHSPHSNLFLVRTSVVVSFAKNSLTSVIADFDHFSSPLSSTPSSPDHAETQSGDNPYHHQQQQQHQQLYTDRHHTEVSDGFSQLQRLARHRWLSNEATPLSARQTGRGTTGDSGDSSSSSSSLFSSMVSAAGAGAVPVPVPVRRDEYTVAGAGDQPEQVLVLDYSVVKRRATAALIEMCSINTNADTELRNDYYSIDTINRLIQRFSWASEGSASTRFVKEGENR